jgi:protein-disulfide isomerase
MWRCWPAVVAVLAGVALGSKLSACAAPGGLGKEANSEADALRLYVPGLDPSTLTTSERRTWVAFVSELPAPCAELSSTLKQCVKERLACRACVPAVRFLFWQVQRGKPAAQIEAAYQARFVPDRVRDVDVEGAPRKGAANPTVLLAEWADFECSACALYAPLLDRKLKAYPEHLALTFSYYPLLRHQDGQRAARAAVAAAKQGKFWRMHALMYLNQHLLSDKGLLKLAREAGLDIGRFQADRHSAAADQIVARDRARADALGLTGTPMIYINGRLFDLDHFSVLDDLDEWIQLEIEIRTGQQVRPRPVDEDSWPPSAPDAQPAASSSQPAPGATSFPAQQGLGDSTSVSGSHLPAQTAPGERDAAAAALTSGGAGGRSEPELSDAGAGL